jgi:hypothetical protein
MLASSNKYIYLIHTHKSERISFYFVLLLRLYKKFLTNIKKPKLSKAAVFGAGYKALTKRSTSEY